MGSGTQLVRLKLGFQASLGLLTTFPRLPAPYPRNVTTHHVRCQDSGPRWTEGALWEAGSLHLMEWALACYIYNPFLLKGLQKSPRFGVVVVMTGSYTPALLVCRVDMGLVAIREKGGGAGRAGGQEKSYYRQSRPHCGWTCGGSNDQIWVSKPGLQKEKCEIFIFFYEVLSILKDPVFLVTPLGMVDVGSSQPEICGGGEEGGGGGGPGWGRGRG